MVGKKNIPKNKPVIFAANHQNAFLDPVLIAVQLSKPTYYLVRADVFKKPTVAKIFASINMMPVYRERDGVDTLQANVEVFNRCFEVLSKNRPIVIFPEGNHGKYKTLRPLKKGFARIAAGAEEKFGKEIDVQIIPVGLNYSDHHNMGAELLINFGEPINVSDYLTEIDNARQINELKDVLSHRMSDAIIDIQLKGHYATIHEMMLMFEDRLLKGKEVSILDKFNTQKEFIKKAEHYFKAHPNDQLESEVISFKKDVEKAGLRYWLFSSDKHAVFVPIVGLVLFVPIHVYGMINHYLPYKIPVWFVKNKVKDEQFQSSMKMAFGVVLFTLFWTLQTLLVAALTDGIALWYLLSLPITAWISYQYWISMLRTAGKIKFNQLKDTRLKQTYAKFKQYFEEIEKE